MPHIVFVEMSMTGAGEGCVAYALERGYAVTVLAGRPEHYEEALRGTPVCRVECDTDDHAAVVAAVQALDGRHRVDGVTTTHDLYVPHAAAAATALKLPGLTFEAAVGVRDKHLMRQTLQRCCPELNPPFRLVHDEASARAAAADIGYPVVAKPVNANDSWQVRRLDTETQLGDYLRAARDWPSWIAPGVLLEGFVAGSEHSVETRQYPGGELELLAVTSKELLGQDGGNFAEAGIALPAPRAVAALLFPAVRRALYHLGVDCGVIHTECRIRSGRVTVLEVNPRLAGDMTGSHMIEVAYGASPLQQVVEVALGRDVPWRPIRAMAAGKFAVCMPRTGTFRGIANLDEVRAMPGVRAVRVGALPGTIYHHPPQSNVDLLARVIAGADTPGQALALAKRAAARAEVIIDE